MRADRDERIAAEDARSRHSTQTILTAIAVLILAGAAYLLAPGDDDAIEVPEPEAEAEPLSAPQPPQPDPAATIANAPDIPEAAPESEPEPESELISDAKTLPDAEPVAIADVAPPPPTPEELDRRLREGIAAAGLQVDAPLDVSVAAPYLLDRTVSSLDQMARGLVPARTLNLPKPQGAFPTFNEGQTYRLDPAGYARYDAIVAAATAVPVDTLAALFRRFRTELTDAYASLGYPADAMDNTLIAALDAVIAVPTLTDPPRLRSKGALWAFEDPELEAASDLQKQIMRTGPDNTRALQAWARGLKSALLNP